MIKLSKILSEVQLVNTISFDMLKKLYDEIYTKLEDIYDGDEIVDMDGKLYKISHDKYHLFIIDGFEKSHYKNLTYLD